MGGDPAPVVRWTRQGRETLPGTATVQPHQGLAISNLHPSDQVSTEEPFQSFVFILVCRTVALTTLLPGDVRLLGFKQGGQCDCFGNVESARAPCDQCQASRPLSGKPKAFFL